MTFALELLLTQGEVTRTLSESLKLPATFAFCSQDINALEGCLRVCQGKIQTSDFSEPIVRLCTQWLRKIPWILSGDTETVALRNSDQCFAFVPAGDSVEWSFFYGSETEIEEYIVEPTTVRLELFIKSSLIMGEQLLQLLKGIDSALLDNTEEGKDYTISLTEAQRAWREQKLRQRR